MSRPGGGPYTRAGAPEAGAGARAGAPLSEAAGAPPAPPPGQVLSAADGGISADVHLTLGDFTLDVRLEVPAGGITAVMGPNGSGKTTLLRCLAGLEAAEAGRISLAGQLVDDPAAGVWVPPERRGVGFAYQDVRLFGHLRALDNVAFGPRCRGARRGPARRTALAGLEAVGMADSAAAKPPRLSGGQAQRVALARALAGAPPVLLLDEPFSATDAEVRPLLRRLIRAAGATVVLVTHDPADAEETADEVVALDAGRITT